MQQKPENFLNPQHPAPVGRLKLEVVDLKKSSIDGSVHGTMGTATATITITACIGSFADED